MPFDLKGKNVLVTGGSQGLGEVICQTFAAQGSNVAINYFNRAGPAEELAKSLEEKHGIKAVTLKGNAHTPSGCTDLVNEAKEKLGGLDVVISNAGYTKFSTFANFDELSEEDWDLAWSAQVKGPLALLRASKEVFNANPEGGVLLITSSIAANSQGGSSMAYAVTKAAQVQLMKCLASTSGPKIRINAVLPGFLDTEWGRKYPAEVIAAVKDRAALKHETHLQDCADAYVMLAKNTSMTGTKVQVDAGLNIIGN